MKSFNLPAFSLAVPEPWADRSTYAFVESGGAGFNASCVVSSQTLAAGVSFQDVVGRDVQLLRTHLPEFAPQDPPSATDVNGYEAIQMQFTSRSPDRRLIRQWQVYVNAESQVYTLTFSQLAEHFEEELPVFRGILASFRPARSNPSA